EARQTPKIELAPLKAPTNEACIHCHVDTTGRPAGFPTIDIYQHFKPVCLDCHDPHTAQAKRPPEVLHPRADLPACITCHGPDGFKARNQRHPVEATNDAACLECHAKGRGPQRVENR
ncbi:MAG: cytochrome c3 family protein, partial [Candidatus Limnocylindrales bacterium]